MTDPSTKYFQDSLKNTKGLGKAPTKGRVFDPRVLVSRQSPDQTRIQTETLDRYRKQK